MKRSGGFTLLELLVSVGLLALLVLTLSMIFSNGLKALRIGYQRAEVTASARTALDQMMREIPSAIVDAAGSYAFVGYDAANAAKLQGSESTGPELYFTGQVEGAGKGHVAEIGYWLRSRELMRFYDTDERSGFELYAPGKLRADFTTGSGSDLLSENVNAITITYYYHSTDLAAWNTTTNWDSRVNAVVNLDPDGTDKNPDGLPDAVEIRLVVQDRLEKETPQTFVTYIPLET